MELYFFHASLSFHGSDDSEAMEYLQAFQKTFIQHTPEGHLGLKTHRPAVARGQDPRSAPADRTPHPPTLRRLINQPLPAGDTLPEPGRVHAGAGLVAGPWLGWWLQYVNWRWRRPWGLRP